MTYYYGLPTYDHHIIVFQYETLSIISDANLKEFDSFKIVLFTLSHEVLRPYLNENSHMTAQDVPYFHRCNVNSPFFKALMVNYQEKEKTCPFTSKMSIITAICKTRGQEVNEITQNTKTRKREIVTTRQLIMVFARSILELSYASTGLIFNKDHATAMNAENVIRNLYETDREWKDYIDEIAVKQFKISLPTVPKKLFGNKYDPPKKKSEKVVFS